MTRPVFPRPALPIVESHPAPCPSPAATTVSSSIGGDSSLGFIVASPFDCFSLTFGDALSWWLEAMLTALALLLTELEKADFREWVSELVSLAASKEGTVRMVWTIFWAPRGDGEGLLVDWILVFPSKRVFVLLRRALPVGVVRLRLGCGPLDGVVAVGDDVLVEDSAWGSMMDRCQLKKEKLLVRSAAIVPLEVMEQNTTEGVVNQRLGKWAGSGWGVLSSRACAIWEILTKSQVLPNI